MEDEYSHDIVGWHVADRITSAEMLKAVEHSIAKHLPDTGDFENKLILHTDRGSQFKSKEYQGLLDGAGIIKSMCAKGKSSENPVIERFNGILKNELLGQEVFTSLEELTSKVDKAVYIYNEKRPHLSCEMLTPAEARIHGGPFKKLWRQRTRKAITRP